MGGAVDGFEVLGDGLGGAGDDGDADGGLVPEGCAFVELGDGEVEGVAELVLERTDDLTTVFEGLGVGDGDFESELADGHRRARSWIGCVTMGASLIVSRFDSMMAGSDGCLVPSSIHLALTDL